VVAEPAGNGPLQSLQELRATVLTPLATAGIVLLFVVFLLLEKRDLRDRLLRLAGANLHRSTEAMREAGSRVSLRADVMVMLVQVHAAAQRDTLGAAAAQATAAAAGPSERSPIPGAAPA